MSLLLRQFRPFLPWFCTSLALGYVAYLTWKIRRLKKENKKRPINQDTAFTARHDVNIDSIDRDNPNKRVAYCRCWKSETFPFCDGKHKYHNKDHCDKVGPLVLVWNNEPEPELKALDTSIIEADMDIKSIDSNSPILHSSNGGDSNGEFEMGKIGDANISSDEQLSSMEMIEEGFDQPQPGQHEHKQSNEEEEDEDTVKVAEQS